MARFVSGLAMEPFPQQLRDPGAWLMSAVGAFERRRAAWGLGDTRAGAGPPAPLDPLPGGSGGLPIDSLPENVQRAVFELEGRLQGHIQAEDFDWRVVERLQVS